MVLHGQAEAVGSPNVAWLIWHFVNYPSTNLRLILTFYLRKMPERDGPHYFGHCLAQARTASGRCTPMAD